VLGQVRIPPPSKDQRNYNSNGCGGPNRQLPPTLAPKALCLERMPAIAGELPASCQ
jgi:hypothetical protein